MNEPQLALRTLVGGLCLLVLLIFISWMVNGLTVLLTGQPLIQIASSGEVVLLGEIKGCLLEAWGCLPR